MLLAGSDTVGLAITYCLHFLSQHPDVQTRVRDEILSIPSISDSVKPVSTRTKTFEVPDSGFAETFSPASGPIDLPPQAVDYTPQELCDALEALPLLDAVVRETLRLCPPVHGTIRVATQDDQIPISQPVYMRDGTVIHKGEYFSIRKGSYIHIPIEGINYSEELYGKDACQFKCVFPAPKASRVNFTN